MKKHNALLKAARIKKSWTPEFVSERVGVSLNTYQRWESGLQTPRPLSLYALCQVFEMSPEELGFSQSGKTSLAQESLYIQQNTDTFRSEYTSEQNVLAEALERWAKEVASCWELYMLGGQVDLERLLPAYLANLAKPTLTPGPEQKIAAGLTAQVYQLLALLELQRADFVNAQIQATQALVYSQIADDWNLYIASQIRLAMIFAARKRVGSALSSYNDALRRVNAESDSISPILHSWIFSGLAEIQATMGREKEALQFLQLALAVFPEEPEQDPCFSYTRSDRSALFLYEGLVFLRLGQPRLAWDALFQVDDLKPPPPSRIRAEFLRLKAYTSFVLGNMIQSCIYLEAAAKSAQEITSDLAFSEIYLLYEHFLAVWGQEPRVRALSRLFQR